MKIERQNAVKVENFAVPVWLFAPKTQLNVRMSGLTPDLTPDPSYYHEHE